MRGVLGLSSSLTTLTRKSSVAQPTVRTVTSPLLHRRFYRTPTQTTTRTTVTSSASISSMAASFYPEKARVPPALPAPTTLITKVLLPLYMREREIEREFVYLFFLI